MKLKYTNTLCQNSMTRSRMVLYFVLTLNSYFVYV